MRNAKTVATAEGLANSLTTSAPAIAVKPGSTKEASQYWVNMAVITDMARLKEHDLSGVAYLFEMGFAIDKLDDSFEKEGRNENFNRILRLKNDFRADIRDVKATLQPGDWAVMPLTDDPCEGDICLYIHRIDPEGGIDVDEVCAKRAKKRQTF